MPSTLLDYCRLPRHSSVVAFLLLGCKTATSTHNHVHVHACRRLRDDDVIIIIMIIIIIIIIVVVGGGGVVYHNSRASFSSFMNKVMSPDFVANQ